MAISPILIEFLTKGLPQVEQAFKGIIDAAARAERSQVQAIDRASGERKAKLSKRAREEGIIQRQAMQETHKIMAKSAADAVKAADKAEAERLKARQKWWKAELKAADKQVKENAKIRREAEREVNRDLDRAAKERQAKREAEAKAQAAAAKKAEKAKYDAIRDRIDRTKQAEKDLDAWQRKEAASQKSKDAAIARSARDQFMERRRIAGALIGAGVQGVMAGGRRVGSVAMGLATTTAQLGGGFSISDVVEKEIGATRRAANVASSTVGQNVTTKDVLNAAKPVSARYGIETEDAVAGIEKIKDLTGDTQLGMKLLPELAKLATAFGGSVDDLAENAGNIALGGKEDGTKMSVKDIMTLMRVQTMQGAVGAVEMKDMARYGGRFTAGASLFGGDRAENIASMSAMAQVARQHGGAVSPAEAALASQRFATDIQKNADKLERAGIKTSDGKGGLRSMKDIMNDMLQQSGGDVTKLTQFGIGERGIRVLTGFSDIYRKAGGGAQGKEAVQKEWEKFTKGVSEADVDKRAANRLSESDKQLEVAFQKLRQEAGEKLLPVFIQMIPALQKLIPMFVNAATVGIPAFTSLMESVAKFAEANKGIIESIAAHPVGAIMAVEITKSFAAAGLPTLLRGIFASLGKGNLPVPTPPPGVTPPPGGPRPTGLLDAAAAAAAAGAATYSLAKPSVDSVLAGQTSGQYKTGELIASLKNGTPEEKAAAKAKIDALQARYGGAKGVLSQYAGLSTSALGEVYSGITGEGNFGANELSKATQAREIIGNSEIQQLVAALNGNTEAVKKSGSDFPNGSGGNSGANGAARQGVTIRDR